MSAEIFISYSQKSQVFSRNNTALFRCVRRPLERDAKLVIQRYSHNNAVVTWSPKASLTCPCVFQKDPALHSQRIKQFIKFICLAHKLDVFEKKPLPCWRLIFCRASEAAFRLLYPPTHKTHPKNNPSFWGIWVLMNNENLYLRLRCTLTSDAQIWCNKVHGWIR